MLELKGITKEYHTGGEVVHALKGIDLKFRKGEFVAILGQSGCGKTTMLNIIGGLDQYTNGDLIINGKSTKMYNDRDWDGYRNHSIGFVFQSYNLIPHQTVLQNVEIALTLSGVSKKERRQRAIDALTSVGLKSQLNKRPAEMSGGQMQRVAMARAIVNNPDIILADEPTGALDTETSVQVMDILKEISKDRLVIMVTHNPELAEKYATRTIRMLDGLITADSNPLTEEETEILRKEDEEILERTKNVNEKKPSMSLFTSFGLSLKNLFTKMGRTALTSFAGSIGIIGIALIYAVSNGMTTYIDIVQEETLSSYPLTLQAQTYDLTSIMQTVMDMSKGESTHEKDAVYEKSIVYELVQAISGIETSENDLGAFKEYLDNKLADTSENGNALKDSISGVSYSYDLRLKLFTKNIDGKINQVDPTGLMQKLITGSSSAGGAGAFDSTGASYAALMGGGGFTTWQEILPGLDGDLVSETVKKQYDVVYGSWPKAYDEVVVVLDKQSELPDMTLYALGLISESEMKERMKNAQKEDADHTVETHKWTYEEICSREYVTVLPSSYYTLDEETGELTDLSATEAGLLHLYNNGIKFKVVGVLCPKEDALSPMLSGAIAYTAELKEYVIEQAKLSQTVKLQEDNKNVDIFTGLLFKKNVNAMTDKEMATDFEEYVKNLFAEKKTAIYLKMTSMPSDEFIAELVQTEVDSKSVEEIKTILVNYMAATQGAPSSMIEMYINQMPEAEIIGYYKQMVEAQIREEYKKAAENATNDKTPEQTAALFDAMVANSTEEELAYYYQNCLTFSSANYENNLTKLGALDLEKPRSINLYAVSFDDKDVIVDEIKAYNEQMEDVKKISYTDYVGLLMSSVNTIIDAITYVLIAFVSISLIVSSIMIGVITLISVQERTKEIGILRAIGASKANVSSMFNAETVIIGFTSGLLGVLITYVLCVPINLILNALTGIGNLKAILPAEVGLLLILISVFLTLIAGIIPSRSAAKKDPVVALRTE